MARIAVIGAGYVGLTTAACFAHLGHDVVCADVVPEKVDGLSRGEIPIVEAGLEQLVGEGLRSGRLRFVLGARAAAEAAEFAFLCVPTPQGADGSADLSYIEAAVADLAPVLDRDAVVVNKSTVPVGSTKVVERVLGRPEVKVVSNPEFLREGSAVHDFLHPDRIVVGSDDQAASVKVASLYIGVPAPLIVTDPASAETIKYAANAFLATKVSFANAVAAVCEAVGADVADVMLGIGYDKRIGAEFLRPGPGWGGSCFVGDETVLARRHGQTRLMSFEALAAAIDRDGASGWEVLAWAPGEVRPAFAPIAAASRRRYSGSVVHIRTKMGRRLTVTDDHPLVVTDGRGSPPVVKPAGSVGSADWLPLALGSPLHDCASPPTGRLHDVVEAGHVGPEEVIVRLWPRQLRQLEERLDRLSSDRRRDALRSGTLRLSEVYAVGVDSEGGDWGTTTNGTYAPACFDLTGLFWRVVGLYLAEGWITQDGPRRRVCWAFHPTGEQPLVDDVAGFWGQLGVKTATRRLSTTCQVSLSSRLVAHLFDDVLGLGRSSADKRIPDIAWTLPDEHKEALLRGLWAGDGSFSLVNGGPSVVLEYGTVSRALADGMVRLLADLGIVARLKVGRTAKSTLDTYWLVISGADQVERSLFLLSDAEADAVEAWLRLAKKRIAPTGYRPDGKGTAWVRVVSAESHDFDGEVFSVEVPGWHTVVTSFGLVAHNCLPKDTSALVRIAEDAGYDFDLLRGVITVNDEQRERVVDKVRRAAGGSLEAATIAVWGLAFKAGTDDLRDSPALAIVDRLLAEGARVRVHDPVVNLPPNGVEATGDPYAACEGADALVVLTEWDEFRWVEPDKVAALMRRPAVVDARNVLDRSAWRRAGFAYEGIGR